MISFDIQSVFRTRWIWFSEPHDVAGVDEVAFLSYEQQDVPGFKRKQGSTRVVRLSKPEEELWADLRETFVRKQILKGRASGIRVREGTLEEFLPLYRSLQEAKGFAPASVRAAAAVGTVLVAEQKGVLLSGGLFIGDGTRVRAYALASKRFNTGGGREREQVGYASRMVLWEAMRHYRAEGYQLFDMGGINSGEGGRTLNEFKEAFGGEEKLYFFYRKTYSPLLRFVRRIRASLPL